MSWDFIVKQLQMALESIWSDSGRNVHKLGNVSHSLVLFILFSVTFTPDSVTLSHNLKCKQTNEM